MSHIPALPFREYAQGLWVTLAGEGPGEPGLAYPGAEACLARKTQGRNRVLSGPLVKQVERSGAVTRVSPGPMPDASALAFTVWLHVPPGRPHKVQIKGSPEHRPVLNARLRVTFQEEIFAVLLGLLEGVSVSITCGRQFGVTDPPHLAGEPDTVHT